MKVHNRPAKSIANISSALLELPKNIEKTLKDLDTYKAVAKLIFNKNSALFLGRGMYFPIAREGALKLKEISYIHAEAYPAGELKHGPLALIDKNMPVIAVVPDNEHLDKILSNLQEVSARKGKVFSIGPLGKTRISKDGGHIKIPKTIDLLNPVISIVPMQLISYFSAIYKGTDVDKPRNLAKSVTSNKLNEWLLRIFAISFAFSVVQDYIRPNYDGANGIIIYFLELLQISYQELDCLLCYM